MHSYGHTVSDTDKTYVTGADRYRISYLLSLTPERSDFAPLTESLCIPFENRRSDGYGLAFVQSEEHSATFVGPVEHIAEVSVHGIPLDTSLGVFLEFWPQSQGWGEVIPDITWNKNGAGIYREFAHRGTTVIAYEYVEEHGGEHIPMVGFHCLYCHRDDLQYHSENHGPRERRWIAAQARKHIRRQNECRLADPRIAEIVTAAANEMYSVDNPVVSYESRCSTTGPCAQIRHLRAAAFPPATPHSVVDRSSGSSTAAAPSGAKRRFDERG